MSQTVSVAAVDAVPEIDASGGDVQQVTRRSAARRVHTISILVRDRPGVLVRVALVFARRGYNIEGMVVSPGIDQGELSRMTISCSGDDATLEQIRKQLAKLVDVVHAIDHTGEDVLETEIALIKIRCPLEERTGILQIADQYRAKVVDYDASALVLRVYGSPAKLNAVIGLLEGYAVVELVRSGKLLMARGLHTT